MAIDCAGLRRTKLLKKETTTILHIKHIIKYIIIDKINNSWKKDIYYVFITK